MGEIHVFFVLSHFHLLVVEQIIRTKSIKTEDCYFIIGRGLVIPGKYHDRVLYDITINSLYHRILMYYKFGRRRWRGMASHSICAYIPFQYSFPFKRFFSKYVFFEEGFSAYWSKEMSYDNHISKSTCMKYIIISCMIPFANDNIKGIIAGLNYDTKQPFPCTLLRLSPEAYHVIEGIPEVNIETLKMDCSNTFKDYDVRDSLILVMDRLSNQGRPFDDNNYLEILKSTISDLKFDKKTIIVKLHPADSNNNGAKERIQNELLDFNISIITYSLEELAISNQHNFFLGTNSTILYYAPLLGDTNKSISFSRLLANKDEKYRDFLSNWGGVDKFCELFGKEVECL